MNEEELKKYIHDNLRIYADLEDIYFRPNSPKRLVITLTLGSEKISETKLII